MFNKCTKKNLAITQGFLWNVEELTFLIIGLFSNKFKLILEIWVSYIENYMFWASISPSTTIQFNIVY